MEWPFDIESKVLIELSFNRVWLEFIYIDNIPELIPSIVASVSDHNTRSFMFISFTYIMSVQVNLNNFSKLIHYAIVFISE